MSSIMFQSVTPSRIEENFKIWDFSLSPEDMAVFDKMNVGWRHLLWAETSMHPDYPFKVALNIRSLKLSCFVLLSGLSAS